MKRKALVDPDLLPSLREAFGDVLPDDVRAAFRVAVRRGSGIRSRNRARVRCPQRRSGRIVRPTARRSRRRVASSSDDPSEPERHSAGAAA